MVSKIYRITPKNEHPIFLAGAGDGPLIGEFVDAITGEFDEYFADLRKSNKRIERSLPSYPSILLWTGRKEITGLARRVRKQYIKDNGIRELYPGEVGFECLIGTSDPHDATELIQVDAMGGAPSRIESGMVGAIGSGASSGGRMLLQQLYSPKMDARQVSRLVAFVIEQVGSIDNYVSGLDTMRIAYHGKAQKVEGENYKQLVDEARNRFENFRETWLD